VNGYDFAGIVVLLTFLAFAVREISGHGLSGKRKLALAAIWLGVFVGLALLIERFAT
jgi:hypothetical protein